MQDMTVLVFVVVLGRGFVNYNKHLCAAHAQLLTTADELCELLDALPACVFACSRLLSCSVPDVSTRTTRISPHISRFSGSKFFQMHRSLKGAEAKLC